MRPNVPPEPIQAHSRPCRFRACDLKHTRSNSQAGISRNDLDTCHPFRQLASLPCSQLPSGIQIACIFIEDGIDFLACAVCQGGCGAEVCVEVPVAFEDIEFVCGFLLVLTMR